MKLTERFNKLSDLAKNFAILSIIGVLGTLVCIPLALIPAVGLGGPLGFLLGSLLELFSYWTIVRGSDVILSKEKSKPANVVLVVVFYVLRLGLIAGALILAGFCTFRWDAHYLYIWTVFAGLLPVYPYLIVSTLAHKGAKKAGDEK